MFGFEKLEVWQLAIEFADQVYAQTAGFPTDERFGLTSQMRRAAVSVSANIAEGSGRGSKQDFARFLEIAYGSLMEVVSQTHIAFRREMLAQAEFRSLGQQADRLARMLSGLRASIQQSQPRSNRPPEE
ncbi:MAG: four helix bundle protein [Planctomycetes bacterium]|nr:four helix bundle protein [Planctomycetota bacterium]